MNNIKSVTVPSVCNHDCGGCCPLSIIVEDGKIKKIIPNHGNHEELKPCARGLLYHYRVYDSKRLKEPLKRIGNRGEGKFKKVSWQEALDDIAIKIKFIIKNYGAESILNLSWSGSTGQLHHQSASRNFFNLLGGQTLYWGGASFQGGFFASLATYGKLDTGNNRSDLLNSQFIILWGINPAESIFGTETRWFLSKAKDLGIKIVCIDPRYTMTAAKLADIWIPINPGTDAALAIAIAYVIIKNNMQDQQFLDKYTVGFKKFRSYVIGLDDGIPKSPEWAEHITGVSAKNIYELAFEYAIKKPAAIIPGFAPGRTAAGEQFHRATATLQCMTGNVGVAGGSTGCLDLCFSAVPAMIRSVPQNYIDLFSAVPNNTNPVEIGQPLHEYSVGGIRTHTNEKINCSKVWDAILRGREGGYSSDYKMIFIQGGNALNQLPDTNKGVKALKSLSFIVVNDMFLTPTAKYADYVLPVTTWAERNDIRLPWMFGRYACFTNKAIDPLYNSKNDIQIFYELGKKMGIEFNFSDANEDEWLKYIANKLGIKSFKKLKENGIYKENNENSVAFLMEIKNPNKYPFPTPSGKIEIYSKRIADFNNLDVLPPIPKYIDTWEGARDPLRKIYPFQLITVHSIQRTHSQFHNIPWFNDLEPHNVWINYSDAKEKRINHNDMVKVFNKRGTIKLQAKVTQRIKPGIVAIYQGAWFQPNEDERIDHGGCVNVLTKGDHSPGGAFCSNTVLVEVERIK